MRETYNYPTKKRSNLLHLLVRFFVGAIVLGVTAFLTPGFAIAGIVPLLVASIVLAGLDFLAFVVFGLDATPFGRGLSGFIMAVVTIYITQFLVAGFSVTLMGAVIGALVYGIVDAIIPGRTL